MYAVPDVDEVVAVAKELGIHLGPEEALLYRKQLMEQLRDLDSYASQQVATVPAAKRKVLTSHDAFGYFAAAYGVAARCYAQRKAGGWVTGIATDRRTVTAARPD